jgi:hypothetical protein
MLSAHRDVTIVAADFGLRAIDNGFAGLINAQIHRRFAAAVTHAL